MPGFIQVKGARQHNLKNIDCRIPRDKLVVFTGVSGSGKSSLAFDTLYAEGQRRYVESLSSYARQFLGQLEKPQVDHIDGLSPAISIDQKAPSRNPRSTVGTVTEIHDYLRVLYARLGVQHCHRCGRVVGKQTPQQMAERMLALPAGTKLLLYAPVVRGRKGEYRDVLKKLQDDGFARVRIDGTLIDLSVGQHPRLSKTMTHDVEALVDRVVIGKVERSRLVDSAETALRLSEGLLLAETEHGEDFLLGENYACVHCGISFEELIPQHFSFNSPRGACTRCSGLGTLLSVDPDRLVVDPDLSVMNGAIAIFGNLAEKESLSWWSQRLLQIAKHYKINLRKPWRQLPKRHQRILMFGDERRIRYRYESSNFEGEFEGRVVGFATEVERLIKTTHSERRRRYYQQFLNEGVCPQCKGQKLRPESLAVKLGGCNIAEVGKLSIEQAFAHFANLDLPREQKEVAKDILREVRDRIGFLLNVGLEYLTLDRPAPSLSGGESQRIRLASQIGSRLVGVLYILDEPSIGLHQRDNRRLLRMLQELRDMGNTVVIVEHDQETIEAADHVLDFGPGAGIKGGQIVFSGTVDELKEGARTALAREASRADLHEAAANGQSRVAVTAAAAHDAAAGASDGDGHGSAAASLTGAYLIGRERIEIPQRRREPGKTSMIVKGARHNNLRNIDARFPLGLFVAVTGVSGSGKSSLVSETLYPALARTLHEATGRVGPHTRITGLTEIDKVIDINQDPIGRTPRSNPSTYVKVFDVIRDIYAQLPLSRSRGYKPGRFSFNVKGGRCEECEGHGQNCIEMHFLADVWVTCLACKGTRFNAQTLEVRYRGKSIADVLEMDVQEALEFFENHRDIVQILQTLHDVGLDYIKLGQPATTLSGGEAQRVKLSRELARRATGRTLYMLDEPTTGLHFHDIKRLLEVLHRLVDAGNTVIVIEHNLDVIKTADWVLDLGPEGGEGGGRIVAEGPPEHVARVPQSHTGRYLAEILRAGRRGRAAPDETSARASA
jgi:excinuclease ABC subunit A